MFEQPINRNDSWRYKLKRTFDNINQRISAAPEPRRQTNTIEQSPCKSCSSKQLASSRNMFYNAMLENRMCTVPLIVRTPFFKVPNAGKQKPSTNNAQMLATRTIHPQGSVT
jgi:hypothetical protein